jgi:methyl-accepting chemotaxis protein
VLGSLRTRFALTLAAFGVLGALGGAAIVYALDLRSWGALAAIAGVSGVALLAGRAVARAATAPLERLAAASASFASGDHSVRVDVDGPREVRLVGEAF